MQVPPGTYTVTTVGGNDLALIEYAHNKPLVFGCYEQANSASNQRQWYLKPSSRGEGYVLQNVWSKWYIKLDSGGQHKADFYGATIWNLDHGSGDSYKLSVLGTSHRMGIAYPNEAFRYVGLIETNVADGKSHLWKLEKLSDDAGESPPPPPPCAQCNATHCPPVDVRPNNATDSANSISYPDDEHCYTDALFNMPRAPFTRAQRLLALDWARNLGGKNVPTITSFDECERRLDGRSGSNPAVVPSQPHGPPAGRATAVLNQPHLYTDMLFNMPRTPLAPTQRIAALNWARQLGANNVPTIESFDECERELETR